MGLPHGADCERGVELLQLYARDARQAQPQFGAQWEQWWRGKTGETAAAAPWSVTLPAEGEGSWRVAPAGLGDWSSWGVPKLECLTCPVVSDARHRRTPRPRHQRASPGR